MDKVYRNAKEDFPMIVNVYETPKQVSKACAMMIAAQLTKKPGSVLGLATGSSPVETYGYLVKWHKKGVLDFSGAVSYNLDEYVGIDEANPCSYHQFMKDNLFDHVNFKASHLPNGNAPDMDKECRRYDEEIRAAGFVDLQLLGIGRNSHIGFNEPAPAFSDGTQVVDLTPSTIEANRRFFEKESDVPRKAVSMGIGTIMSARSIVLIAMGEDKAEAIRGLVKGDITPQLPASILRLHGDTVILCDRAAASLL